MRTILLSLAPLALVLSGCATAVVGGAAAVGVAAGQERTIGAAVDDATASQEIKFKLLGREGMNMRAVDVEVSEGLVLLSGRVSTPEEKVEAERIAWDVDRVRQVSNEIVISGPDGIRKNLHDEWITARIRARFVGDKTVQAINYNIETHNGVVYLMGVAQGQDELDQAASLASTVPGVARVVSYVRLPQQRLALGPAR
jgi:osmotically-inducible protein OsmY